MDLKIRLKYIYIFISLYFLTGGFYTFINDQNHSVLEGSLLVQSLFSIIYFIAFGLLIIDKFKGNFEFSKIEHEKWLFFLVGFVALSLFWSAVPEVSFRRIVALVGTTLFGIYFGINYTIKQQLHLLSWIFCFVIVISLVMIFFFPAYGLFQDPRGTSWQGVFGHKNELGEAMYLSSLVFFVLFNYKNHSFTKRVLFFSLFVLSFVMLLKSHSMTSIIVFTCTLVSYFIMKIVRTKGNLKIALFCFFSSMSFVAIILVYEFYKLILINMGRDPSLTGRTDIWKEVLNYIFKRPVLGYGYDGFWNGWIGPSADLYLSLGKVVSHSHNGYLDQLLDLGMMGFFLFLICSLVLFKYAIQYVNENKTSIGMWPLLFLISLFITNFAESSILERNSIFWVLFISLFFGFKKQKSAKGIKNPKVTNNRKKGRYIPREVSQYQYNSQGIGFEKC